MRRIFLLLIWTVLGVVLAVTAAESTQEQTLNQWDSLRCKPIYFRLESSIIDSSFKKNNETLQQLGLIFTDTTIISHLNSVHITATTSPDGNPAYNRMLASRRVKTVKNYIEQNYPYIDQNKIATSGYVENWMRLRPMLSKQTPYYLQIISILDQQLTPQATESHLRQIDGGKAWNEIVRNYLPKMRSAVTLVIYSQGEIPTSTPSPFLIKEPVSVAVPTVLATEPIHIVEEVVMTISEPTRHPLFALKTNLLYDAMTALNIEVEIPIGQRWSIAAEYIFPWWLSDRKQHCLQSLSGYIEGRYWFGDRTNRRQLTGWFAGVYTGGGYYDVEWNNKGYQGEFCISIALSGGYAHQIGRNLSMEYSLGIGYMRTPYREYASAICSDGVQRLIKQRSDTFNWVGPTRIKVSLVWMINSKKRSER